MYFPAIFDIKIKITFLDKFMFTAELKSKIRDFKIEMDLRVCASLLVVS